MYLTYAEYTAAPFNGELEEEVYTTLEYRARKVIDRATHGRIADETEVREAVKYCVYDLVTLYAGTSASMEAISGGIASMSNDGVSVTYGGFGGLSPTAVIAGRESGILKQYLSMECTESGVPILWAGVEI